MMEAGVIDCCIDENGETGAFLFEFNAMCGERVGRAWADLDTDVGRMLSTARASFSSVFAATTTDVPLDPRLISNVADQVVDAVRKGHITAAMKALQAHDDYTFVHSLSVSAVLAFFGREIGIRDGDLG